MESCFKFRELDGDVFVEYYFIFMFLWFHGLGQVELLAVPEQEDFN
jgi:hypothetical protein